MKPKIKGLEKILNSSGHLGKRVWLYSAFKIDQISLFEVDMNDSATS
jgi:hypothetical protein